MYDSARDSVAYIGVIEDVNHKSYMNIEMYILHSGSGHILVGGGTLFDSDLQVTILVQGAGAGRRLDY